MSNPRDQEHQQNADKEDEEDVLGTLADWQMDKYSDELQKIRPTNIRSWGEEGQSLVAGVPTD